MVEDRAARSWTVVGDVGGWSSYHVGDEAMLAANLDLLRSVEPRATLTVVSADPGFTAAEYGCEAVPRLGFDRCASEPEREALLVRLSEQAASSVDLPGAFSRLRGSSDGLLISGGGNLTSTWPACIHERLALCRRAAAVGAPVIVLGQTIGPALEARHRELVAEILHLALWIGVRDEPSFALALELGAPSSRLSYQIDDAASLGAEEDAPVLPIAAGAPWIAVTIHPLVDPTGTDPLLDVLANQLGAIASRTGCQLVFVPHAQAAAAMGACWSDQDVGDALARRMAPGALHTLPIMRARQVASLTGRARMIVSSRYHPLVFALAAGTPCVGIWSDEYTRIKLQGALTHYERVTDSCSVEEVFEGALLARATSLWEERDAACQLIRGHALGNVREERRRRRELAAVLVGSGQSMVAPAAAWAGRRREALTDEEWQAFSRDGFVHLGPVLTPDELRALQARAETLAPPETETGEAEARPFSEGQGLQADDLFCALMQKPLFRDVCARTYGPHVGVSIFRAMVTTTPRGQALPWQQGGGATWQLDRDPLLSIWVALDAATKANGCLEAVRGSHRQGPLDPRRSVLSEEEVRTHCRPDQIVSLEVPAGHAVAVHDWLIRRSGVDQASTPGRAFLMSCLDARTLGVMTGAGFPVLFGHDARTPYPFVRRLLDERATSCAQVAEAESRASSSRQDSLALEAALGEATRTASALGAEVHQHQLELADLGEENRRLRAAVTQMRAEILTLHRRLDLLPPQGHDPQAAPPATAPSKHDWEVMRGDLQRLNAHAIDLASRLNATHGSRSWRVTRPIRAVAHALRRLRPGASGEPEA